MQLNFSIRAKHLCWPLTSPDDRYAIRKQIQWIWSDIYSADTILMVGGLHVEILALKIALHVICFLHASHITQEVRMVTTWYYSLRETYNLYRRHIRKLSGIYDKSSRSHGKTISQMLKS